MDLVSDRVRFQALVSRSVVLWVLHIYVPVSSGASVTVSNALARSRKSNHRSTEYEPCRRAHSPHCMDRYMDRCILRPSCRPPFTASHACKREFLNVFHGGGTSLNHSRRSGRFFYYVQYEHYFFGDVHIHIFVLATQTIPCSQRPL